MIMIKIKSMSTSTKIAIAGVVMCVTGAVLGWGILPAVVKNKIAQIKNLSPGSDGRKVWEKIPFPLVFKIYIFNTTNRAAVNNGAIPVVEEIGPYIFEEWKEKVELEDIEETDSVSYRTKNTWMFNRKKSWPLTGKEVVIIPNPVMMGIILTAERDQPASLGIVAKSLEGLFNDPTDIFLTSTAMDLMFAGNYLNCTSKQFSIKVVCLAIQKSGKFPEMEENLFKFSLLGNRNNTKSAEQYAVNRGTRDISKVGQMVSVNGEAAQSVWTGMPCNSLSGTDGSIFPPFLKRQDILSFAPDICRSMVASYTGISSYKLIPTLHFNSDLGDMTSNPDEKCFCPSDDHCLKRGVMDIWKCQGAPLIASLPHFYNAHDDYQKAVHGMRPDGAKHAITADIEPLTGIPLTAKTRMQFSLPIRPVQGINFTMNLTNVFLPFFWIEEGLDMDDVIVSELRSKVLCVTDGIDIGKWVVTAGGAVTTTISAAWNYVASPFMHKLTFA